MVRQSPTNSPNTRCSSVTEMVPSELRERPQRIIVSKQSWQLRKVEGCIEMEGLCDIRFLRKYFRSSKIGGPGRSALTGSGN